MKKLIIIAIVVIVVVAGIALFIFTSKQGQGPNPGLSTSSSSGALPGINEGSSTIPTSTVTAEHPAGATLQIGTPKGTVTLNNIYNSPSQISQDGTSILVSQADGYNITYYAPDSSFNIGIWKQPVATIRAEAEAAFLTELGVSKTDACKLNVVIGVSYAVDHNYGSQNLGLSFCASSTFGQ